MSRKLNDKQTEILKKVFTFRYVTTDNLARYKNITGNSAYSALEILNKNGCLEKIHDKSYRLLNKSARYYLTLNAIEYLQKVIKLERPDAIWNSRKKDGRRSSDFIDQQVAIHAAYNALHELFGENAHIKTSLELHDEEGIIKPLPGLLVEPKSGKPFFVELTDNQHLFLAKKRIRKYIDNYDDGDWEWEQYPDVYIVRTSSPADRTRLRKYIETRMDDAYLDDDDFTFHVISKLDQAKSSLKNS
jgi:hypothetical protein